MSKEKPNNIIDDLSILTTISKYGLTDISKLAEKCISHYVLECKLSRKPVSTISLGTLGELDIMITDSTVTYKFVPSKSLENEIVSVLNENKSPLQETLEKSLTKRVIKAYKDLL